MGGKAEGGLGVGVQAGQSGVAGIQQKIACLADAAAQGYDLRRKNGVEGNNAGAKLVHILGKHDLRRSIAAAGAGNQVGGDSPPAMRINAVAEAYCSKQPHWPQGQGRPSLWVMICPSSGASPVGCASTAH